MCRRYCQSINFVAGMLLLHMSEEESFWVMDVLVNEILPPAYYWCAPYPFVRPHLPFVISSLILCVFGGSDSLKGLHADQKVLQHLLSRFLPSVSACLTENKASNSPSLFWGSPM